MDLLNDHDQLSNKSFLQNSRVEISKIDEINNGNSHSTIKNSRLGENKDKSINNVSFFFKNKNYRDDIRNESKFQIKNYDMSNMNSMNIINKEQKEQIQKNQQSLQNSGYYDKYYIRKEKDFDKEKLNFSKDRGYNQKQEYQILKEERDKYKEWLEDTRNKNKRLKLLKNRYQTGIIGLENPLVDESVYKSKEILQLDEAQINQKPNTFKNVRKYWDTDSKLMIESCKSEQNRITQEWKRKKKVLEDFIQKKSNTS